MHSIPYYLRSLTDINWSFTAISIAIVSILLAYLLYKKLHR